MLNKSKVFCAVACAALLLSACASTKTPPMSSRIQPGTTQADVLKIMGNPTKVGERCWGASRCYRDLIYGRLNIKLQRNQRTGQYQVYGWDHNGGR